MVLLKAPMASVPLTKPAPCWTDPFSALRRRSPPTRFSRRSLRCCSRWHQGLARSINHSRRRRRRAVARHVCHLTFWPLGNPGARETPLSQTTRGNPRCDLLTLLTHPLTHSLVPPPLPKHHQALGLTRVLPSSSPQMSPRAHGEAHSAYRCETTPTLSSAASLLFSFC